MRIARPALRRRSWLRTPRASNLGAQVAQLSLELFHLPQKVLFKIRQGWSVHGVDASGLDVVVQCIDVKENSSGGRIGRHSAFRPESAEPPLRDVGPLFDDLGDGGQVLHGYHARE